MTYIVDPQSISTAGLESSPHALALAGLRANEARYFLNKYKHIFTVEPASQKKEIVRYVSEILEKERNIRFTSTPLEVSQFQVEDIKWTYVFYESGLSVNVLYTLHNPKKRAVGFKLCEGMNIPNELKDTFKFAKQKSKLAGIIRGSYFVIKGEY